MFRWFTPSLKKKSILLILSILSINVSAVDLGTKGKLFDIVEIDIRVMWIMELSKNMTNDRFQKEAERAAKEFYTTLPRYTLAQSRKYKVEHIDPTRVYEDDYWSFKKNPSGKYEWFKISEAGQQVNWLDTYAGEMQRMFIFDPESEVQIAIAKEVAALRNPFITLVMIGGDLEKTVEKVGAYVTYLNQPVINEYDLQFTPTVITRGDGELKNRYRKVRFNIDEVVSQDVINEIARERNE